MGVRKRINDELLEFNPGLREPLKELSERINAVEEASEAFVKNRELGAFIPGDTTAQKLRRLIKDTSILSQRNMDRFKQKTGFDVVDAAKKAALRESIETGKTIPREARVIDPKLARKSRLIKNIEKKFGFEGEPGELVQSRTTAPFERLGREREIGLKRLIGEFEKETGRQFKNTIEDRLTLNEFLKERTQGSARTALGALFGMAAEPIIPGAHGLTTLLGGGIGRGLDIYGGRAAGSLIDLLSAARRSIR